MHRVISHYNELRMVEDTLIYTWMGNMDGKDKLQKFSKKIPEAENMT